jgi:hypothetical protein
MLISKFSRMKIINNFIYHLKSIIHDRKYFPIDGQAKDIIH